MAKKSNKNTIDNQTANRGAWKKLLSTIFIIGFGIFYMVAGRNFVDSRQAEQTQTQSATVQKIESGVGVTVLLMDNGDVYTVPVEFGIRAEVGTKVKLDKQDGQVQLCIDDHCEVGTPI